MVVDDNVATFLVRPDFTKTQIKTRREDFAVGRRTANRRASVNAPDRIRQAQEH